MQNTKRGTKPILTQAFAIYQNQAFRKTVRETKAAISMASKELFVDTGAYYAFLDRADRYHRQAVEVFKALGNIPQVTTDLIISE